MTKTIGIVLALLLGACVDDLDDHDVSSVEQHTTPTVNNYCYASGATTWCEDFYSGKWCASTSTVFAYGYDYTGCTWKGWNGDLYCSGGWQWDRSQTHRHCP